MILSIETGTDICSVGLAREGRLLSLCESGGGRDHARLLGVYVQQVLERSDIKPADLDAVAVGRGPGSYTGLRVGVSLAKGLCYGLGIPLIAIDSLQALAQVALEDCRAGILPVATLDGAVLCPMIDARRMEVYMRRFDSALNPLSPIGAVVPNERTFADILTENQVVIFGDGASKLKDILAHPRLSWVPVLPSARGMAALAEAAFQRREFADTAYFEPYYLKDFVAIPSKKNFFAK